MDIFSVLIVFSVGLIASVYGTIVGAGGGFIFVPALLIILKVDPVIASGSGLVIVLINSCVGSLGFARQKRIDFSIALRIGLSAIPGSIIGIFLLRVYSSQYFYLIFSVVLVSLGFFLFFKNTNVFKNKKKGKNIYNPPKKQINNFAIFSLGLVMGILSSYLGIGGGWLLVPILVYIFKVPIYNATATSMMSLCIYSSTGVLLQIYYQNIDYLIVIFGGIGVVLGANLGVYVSKKISGKITIHLLSFLLIVIGVRLFFQN